MFLARTLVAYGLIQTHLHEMHARAGIVQLGRPGFAGILDRSLASSSSNSLNHNKVAIESCL